MPASVNLKRLFCQSRTVEFDPQVPVANFIFDGFPDGIAEVEIPVVRFHVYETIERFSCVSIVIFDAGVIDAVEKFLVLCTADSGDKAEFNVDFGRNRICDLNKLWQFLRNRVPLRVDSVRSNVYLRLLACHE